MTNTAERCDLCGETGSRPLVESPRSMTSDCRISPRPLRKIECAGCGLVRDDGSVDLTELTHTYRTTYALNQGPEHVFFTQHGPKARSEVFFDWIGDAIAQARPARILEIGCGAGQLLERMRHGFARTTCHGVELNETAAQMARDRGLEVRLGGVEAAPGADYDLIYSVGVLEHVPSPREFLRAVRRLLVPDGLLVLSQPTQDTVGYDVFFSDHLYHFGNDHIQMYALASRLRERTRLAGHGLMPSFSLHLLTATDHLEQRLWRGRTRCQESVRFYEAVFRRTDDLLRRIANVTSSRLAVFGLSEVFALLRAYSCLDMTTIVAGLSDVPAVVPVDFAVLPPEAASGLGITDVLVCVNPVYLKRLVPRLTSLGFRVHSIWDEDA